MNKLSTKLITDYQKSINDPVYFFERFLNISMNPFQKTAAQMFYDNRCHISYADTGAGKTTLGLGLTAWHAITQIDQNYVVVCKNPVDRKLLANKFWNLIEDTAFKLNIEMKRETQRCIRLSNGIAIYFRDSKNLSTLKGMGINYLFADDFAKWRIKDQDELAFTFMPTMFKSRLLFLFTMPDKNLGKDPLWLKLMAREDFKRYKD